MTITSRPIDIKYHKKNWYKRWYMMLSILSAWHRQLVRNEIQFSWIVESPLAITVQCKVLRKYNGLTKLWLVWRKKKSCEIAIVEFSDAPSYSLCKLLVLCTVARQMGLRHAKSNCQLNNFVVISLILSYLMAAVTKCHADALLVEYIKV